MGGEDNRRIIIEKTEDKEGVTGNLARSRKEKENKGAGFGKREDGD